MAKSGRERKANRRVRKEAEARGAGAKQGISRRGAAELEHRAVTQRWPMPETTKAQLAARVEIGTGTLASFADAATAQIILVAPDNGRGPNRRIDSP